MKGIGWVWGGAAGLALVTACGDAGGAVALTRGQLAERLSSGVTRVEVDLRQDGSVREVEIEDEVGHEEQLEGRIVSLDAAGGLLEVEHLGTVDFKAATRYRTERGTTSSDAWLSQVDAALAAGRAVWLDARGAFRPDGFNANELRWEDDADRGVEAWVRAEDFDQASGTLRVGELTFAIGSAPIRNDDGSGPGNLDDDATDDNATDDNDDDGLDDDGADGSDDDGLDDDATDDNGANGSDDDGLDDNGTDDSDDGLDDNGSDDDGTDDSDDDGTDGSDDGLDDDGTDDDGTDGVGVDADDDHDDDDDDDGDDDDDHDGDDDHDDDDDDDR